MSSSAPHTRQSNQCLPTEPMGNTALVAEGGGQRGIFTAGVLDSWLHAGFNPFDLLIGTSAGAQNLSSYMTCQIGFGRHSITSLSRDPKFFKLSRTFIGKHAVDLDWYFNQVEHAENRLNIG
jgi:predicted patatin/cPLA2 family phospholipase